MGKFFKEALSKRYWRAALDIKKIPKRRGNYFTLDKKLRVSKDHRQRYSFNRRYFASSQISDFYELYNTNIRRTYTWCGRQA